MPSSYVNVPNGATSHAGCTPACLSHNVPASNPYAGNPARPCPSTSQLFPSFSAVGVVPAPVLAAEALPNYYGFLPGLSMPLSPVTYHTSPHVALPRYPVTQNGVLSAATAPLLAPDVSSLNCLSNHCCS